MDPERFHAQRMSAMENVDGEQSDGWIIKSIARRAG
jgi:hypothetical protein